jgi:4-amino-4-deoxy-L-arabinose transferase-like glycosyltransferase
MSVETVRPASRRWGTEEPALPGFLRSTARVAPFAAWAVIVIGALASRPPTAPIELEILSSAWHMSGTGSLVPLVNGDVEPGIPPLGYWLILAGWKAFGVIDIWPRLLSALALLATLILVGRTAQVLWPHRSTTSLFARILLISLGGIVVTSCLIQPEILSLPVVLAGFQAIAILRMNQRTIPEQIGLWLVFAVAIVADLFLVGWAALLLLPPVGLLAPNLRGAERPRGAAARLAPRALAPDGAGDRGDRGRHRRALVSARLGRRRGSLRPRAALVRCFQRGDTA